ncbi:MAG: HAD family phosphatase [Oscillibacter sp.]|nr:HAD family phosphatase [Oscillibacter sp.]
MVKGIIFDMDGVLVDTEWYYQQRRAEFFQRMDFPSPVNSFVGSNEQAIWEALVPDDPEFRQQMLMAYRAYRRLHPVPYQELLNPQVPGLFRALKERGLKTAIASSSYLGGVRKVAEVAGITELVDFMISGEQCAAYKPDPEIYLRAMEALDLTPETALAVEDSPTGITAARRAGLRVYALRPRPELTLDQSAATAVIEQLNDVLEYL